MADYRINLIEPAAISAEDLDKFRSNLRAVLGFIKYSEDGNALDAFLAKESSLMALDVEAARVIKVCTKTELEFDENAEVVNVCKAEQEMKEKARQEGKQEGRQEGKLEALRDVIKNAMEAFNLTGEEAMDKFKVTAEDQALLKKMI